MSEASSEKAQEGPVSKKTFPTIPLDKDGKPCRSCTSFRNWAKQTAHKPSGRPISQTPATTTVTSPPDDCPADIETLGRSTWTLLHTIAATYPPSATSIEQQDMKTFLTVFSRLYPCRTCAEDFQGWIEKPENKLQVGTLEKRTHLSGRSEFALWMCNAHNEVNQRLGKKPFDCSKVDERWRTGWKDGRCDG